MNDLSSASTATQSDTPLATFTSVLLRQFAAPTPVRALVEALVVAAVFVAAGSVALDAPLVELLGPLVPVVLAMMLASIASGVYRPEIGNRISKVFIHSTYGFVLGAAAVIATLFVVAPQMLTVRFVGFFLFFGFFVMNTVRPLLCGTDLNDRGGRRQR